MHDIKLVPVDENLLILDVLHDLIARGWPLPYAVNNPKWILPIRVRISTNFGFADRAIDLLATINRLWEHDLVLDHLRSGFNSQVPIYEPLIELGNEPDRPR